MMRCLLLICICFPGLCLKAQSSDAPSRYIGFNTNPLLAQVIPLNSNNPSLTTASLMFRNYNMNNNGFRAAYGLGLGNENDFSNMYLGLDHDRRRSISDRWNYFHGYGLQLKIVSNNFNRRSTATVEEEFTLALAYHWGVEYRLNEIVSFSTEATLRFGFGLDNEDIVFKLDPPINILVHFNLAN